MLRCAIFGVHFLWISLLACVPFLIYIIPFKLYIWFKSDPILVSITSVYLMFTSWKMSSSSVDFPLNNKYGNRNHNASEGEGAATSKSNMKEILSIPLRMMK